MSNNRSNCREAVDKEIDFQGTIYVPSLGKNILFKVGKVGKQQWIAGDGVEYVPIRLVPEGGTMASCPPLSLEDLRAMLQPVNPLDSPSPKTLQLPQVAGAHTELKTEPIVDQVVSQSTLISPKGHHS